MDAILNSSKIWLKAGSEEKYLYVKQVYPTWQPLDGKVEQDIEGNKSEDWGKNLITYNIVAQFKKEESDPDKATSEWFFNTFLEAINTKEFKENSWGSYLPVVVEGKKIPIKPIKKGLGFVEVNILLVKKNSDDNISYNYLLLGNGDRLLLGSGDKLIITI